MTLHDLGLTECQERLYRALLGNQRLGVHELSHVIGASAARTRAELSGLIQIGLLEVDPVAPADVRVLHPMTALREHIEQAEDELLRQQRVVRAVRAEIDLLSSVYTRRLGIPEGCCERIESPGDVRSRLEEIAALAMTSLHTVQPGAVTQSRCLRAPGRGVIERTICAFGSLNGPDSQSCLGELAANGVEIRLADKCLHHLIVVDSNVAVVAADPIDDRRGVVVVRQAAVAAMLDESFARLWTAAEPLRRPTVDMRDGADALEDQPAHHVTETERRLLALLASGQTDEAAARALGVSVRHLRRGIAALMRRLGAGSRFEAGVLAARRGWI